MQGPRIVTDILLPKNIPAMIKSIKRRIEPKKRIKLENEG